MPGLLEKAADMGLLNVIVPEEYGGPGLDSVTVAVIYEELGKGCAGVATSMAANSLASYPILIAGTEEQKQAHCDLLNDGKLAAFALTEPGWIIVTMSGYPVCRASTRMEDGTMAILIFRSISAH